MDSEGDVGLDTSLALDGTDYPHISYCDVTSGTLKYAYHDGTNWHIETVDAQVDACGDTSLALDGMDRPHISYFDLVDDDLKYAYHDGTGWHIEVVDSAGVRFSSLALDEDNRPHIAYYYHVDSDDLGLKYAWHDGTDWQFEIVENTLVASISLALDSTGRPHISYYYNDDEDAVRLKYAWHDGTSWQFDSLFSLDFVGYISLELDALDRPHISYYHVSDYGYPYHTETRDLQYAWHDGTEWHIEMVESAGDVGGYNSLALDSAEQPRISYYDETDGDLKYAYVGVLIPSTVSLNLRKEATPSDNLTSGSVLTYTLTFSSTGLGTRLWDPLPPTVHYVTGTVTGTVIPAATYDPIANAIAWEGTLSDDTVQTIHFQVTVGVTGTAGSLVLPIVNTAWLTDTTSGNSVSATAIVNGRRIYLPLTLRQF